MGYVRHVVHVPLGSDAEGALCQACLPAGSQGGSSGVAMLLVAERDVRPPHRCGSDGVSFVRENRRRCPSQPVDYRSWGGV